MNPGQNRKQTMKVTKNPTVERIMSILAPLGWTLTDETPSGAIRLLEPPNPDFPNVGEIGRVVWIQKEDLYGFLRGLQLRSTPFRVERTNTMLMKLKG